jgi:CRISPR/Cas system-associated exonuclease Cas4 (RecB family)
MTPFLQQVARHYLQVPALEDYCFVFPNRRSGQFFMQYLKEQLVGAEIKQGASKPHLMPSVTSINEFVTELTRTETASDIEMMFALYKAYCEAMGENAQEFDKFIYWAQLIIGDFNDIDKSLANADEIYRNLSDQHNLSSNYLSAEVQEMVKQIFGDQLFTAFFDCSEEASLWQKRHKTVSSEEGGDDAVKQAFYSLWNALGTIYHNYHDLLRQKDLMSPGMQLRQVAETPPSQSRYSRYVFVGFGVLSAAEVKLFDHFKDKADFWWDNAGLEAMLEKAPNDPGALLIKGYCKRFGAMPVESLDGQQPSVRVVAISSTVGQAKMAFKELEQMGATSSGIDTAIVLPDENLLVPLLHTAPEDITMNVTLGYSLRSSNIVSLMHIVARLHQQASKEKSGWTYYREDVYDILSHPLIKTYFTTEALELSMRLARENRFRVPAAEFEILSFWALFKPAMDSESNSGEQTDYLDNLLSFCDLLMGLMSSEIRDENLPADENEDVSRDEGGGITLPLQQSFLIMYIDVLHQLKRALADDDQSLQRGSLFYMIDRLTSSAIVPFTGEPLQGLQVMGLLETRSLDFKNVVILSMNERVFPRRRGIHSFIPNYIRSAYGMSTVEQQEAIVSFNFYRLLNRASNVSLIYDSSAQKLGSSEPSRFITQLEMVYGWKMQHVEMVPDINPSSSIAIEVPNQGIDLQGLYTRDPDTAGGKYLSASAINKYINCPLSFYLHYVQHLNDENEVSDFMDYGTFGDIIHDTLRACYYSNRPANKEDGVVIDENYIRLFKKNRLDKTVKRYIRKHYLHVPDEELDREEPLRGEAYMLIDTIKSYVEFVLDYDIDLIKQSGNGRLTILECEERCQKKGLVIDGVTFNFDYTPDRIDKLDDGTVRIVDYKTGKDVTSFAATEELPDLFDSDKHDRRKAILQLFLYCHAYLTDHSNVKSVTPVIYKLASMKESGVWLKGGRGTTPVQYVFTRDDAVSQAFVSKMGEVLRALYENNFVQASEKSKACNYCRYIDFCRRTPSKW